MSVSARTRCDVVLMPPTDMELLSLMAWEKISDGNGFPYGA